MDADLRICENCGEPYFPNKRWQKYCSQFCNQSAYYARKRKPPSIIDPLVGPTPIEEAEWERRKNLEPERKPLDPKEQEIIRLAKEDLEKRDEQKQKSDAWTNLGYSGEGDKS